MWPNFIDSDSSKCDSNNSDSVNGDSSNSGDSFVNKILWLQFCDKILFKIL